MKNRLFLSASLLASVATITVGHADQLISIAQCSDGKDSSLDIIVTSEVQHGESIAGRSGFEDAQLRGMHYTHGFLAVFLHGSDGDMIYLNNIESGSQKSIKKGKELLEVEGQQIEMNCTIASNAAEILSGATAQAQGCLPQTQIQNPQLQSNLPSCQTQIQPKN